jgi:hypothetical protein
MVSEDSASQGWFPLVHRLSDRGDLDETGNAEMATSLHELDHFDKLLEVLSLCRPQRIRVEERDNDLVEILEPPHDESIQRLAVIVSSHIDVYPPTVEVITQNRERLNARCPLNHNELRLHLPTNRGGRLTLNWNGEATFAVDEPSYPPCDSQPFLLIVRTRHVVTMVNVQSDVTR